jgi:hypothetical protein
MTASDHSPINKKSVANRSNSRKSTGPHNTSSTRFNATQHGLLSAGITELDDADGYQRTIRQLNERFTPEMTTFLTEHIALQVVRLRRIRRLEAEYITSVLNPAMFEKDPLEDLYPSAIQIDPGLPASMDSTTIGTLAGTYLRYESSIENKLYRAMNQLERMQRAQQGEHLPAPLAVDIGIHSDHRDAGTNAKPAPIVREDSRSEPAGERETTKESG